MQKLFSGLILAPTLLLADFTYSETTRMTGGVLMNMSRALGGLSKDMRKVGEPTTSTVMVKGGRMMTTSGGTVQLWDLDKDTIINIDLEKQTYSTITFAEMKAAMQKAMERAKSNARPSETPAANPENPKPGNTEMNVKMDIKETGKVQMISGLNTREVLMTFILEAKDKQSGESGAMDTMSSIWVADSVPGYDEVKAFHKRVAEKMSNSFAAGAFSRESMMAAMDPRMMNSMQKVAKEAEKLQGVHVRQITKVGVNLDPAKASEITDPSTMPQGPTAGGLAGRAATEGATQSAERRIGGRIGNIGGLGGLGGFGGLGRRKQKEEPPPPPQNQQQPQQGSGVLMEMVMEMNNFSNAPLDASKFAVPAGFKQVPHPMLRGLQQ
ncbi:MAG TPA: hypothetical protein VM120_09600 [Bryobacteraceae bacterium]|nr:hypothetical protein [Bryobacteraceae bacterium]